MRRLAASFTHGCFNGHTHVPGIFIENGPASWDYVSPAQAGNAFGLDRRKWICNVGSVGQPRDGDWARSRSLRRGVRSIWRVEYDVEATIAKIHANAELANFLSACVMGDRVDSFVIDVRIQPTILYLCRPTNRKGTQRRDRHETFSPQTNCCHQEVPCAAMARSRSRSCTGSPGVEAQKQIGNVTAFAEAPSPLEEMVQLCETRTRPLYRRLLNHLFFTRHLHVGPRG